jgi:hypothetical protein
MAGLICATPGIFQRRGAGTRRRPVTKYVSDLNRSVYSSNDTKKHERGRQ